MVLAQKVPPSGRISSLSAAVTKRCCADGVTQPTPRLARFRQPQVCVTPRWRPGRVPTEDRELGLPWPPPELPSRVTTAQGRRGSPHSVVPLLQCHCVPAAGKQGFPTVKHAGSQRRFHPSWKTYTAAQPPPRRGVGTQERVGEGSRVEGPSASHRFLSYLFPYVTDTRSWSKPETLVLPDIAVLNERRTTLCTELHNLRLCNLTYLSAVTRKTILRSVVGLSDSERSKGNPWDGEGNSSCTWWTSPGDLCQPPSP